MKSISFPSLRASQILSFINPRTIGERLSQPHPSIQEPERRRRVVLLSSLLLILNLGGLLAILLALVMDGPGLQFLNILVSGILLFITYRLSRTRFYSIAALLALIIVSTSVLYASILFLDAEILHFLILGVLFSSLFLSPRASILASALFIASILLLHTVIPDFTYADLSRPAFSIGLVGLMATVIATIQSLDFRHIEQQSKNLSSQVNELERGREAQHRSEARLANILDNATEAILAVDKDQKIILFNNGAERVFGYQSTEVLGRPIDILLPPEFIEHHRRYAQGFAGSTMTGMSAHDRQELRGRRKDGSTFPAQIGISSHFENEEVIYTAVLFDITESKKAKEALDRSERLYRKLFEDANDAIFLLTLDGVHVAANQKAADLLGYRREELVGKKISEFVAPVEYPDSLEVQKRLLAGDTVPLYERTFRNKDGTEIPVEINATLVSGSDDTPLYIQSIVRDITERKQKEVQIQRQVKRLSGMRSIEQAITSSLDLRLTLDVLLSEVINQLGTDAVDILLFNPASQMLEISSRQGFHTGALRYTQLRLGESYAGRAALEQRIVHVPDLEESPGGLSQAVLLAREGFKSYYAVPLIAKGQVKGVLELFSRIPLASDPERAEFLESLGAQAAIAIDNAQLFRELQRANLELGLAYDETIEGWSHALDLRDQETEGHTQRVTEMTLRLARAMDVREAELVQVRRGALLHDIGKMGIPDNILLKPGPLDDGEWVVMRKHPVYAYQMLAPIAYLRPALDIPYCHHEKWDGTGYPRGLKGEQIPLVARIFAVVDVWDALGSDRPYRPAWPRAKVESYIQEQAGVHFDPRMVDVFMKILGQPR